MHRYGRRDGLPLNAKKGAPTCALGLRLSSVGIYAAFATLMATKASATISSNMARIRAQSNVISASANRAKSSAASGSYDAMRCNRSPLFNTHSFYNHPCEYLSIIIKQLLRMRNLLIDNCYYVSSKRRFRTAFRISRTIRICSSDATLRKCSKS